MQPWESPGNVCPGIQTCIRDKQGLFTRNEPSGGIFGWFWQASSSLAKSVSRRCCGVFGPRFGGCDVEGTAWHPGKQPFRLRSRLGQRFRFQLLC